MLVGTIKNLDVQGGNSFKYKLLLFCLIIQILIFCTDRKVPDVQTM